MQEASQTFQRIIAMQPANAEAHLNLGIALADGYDLEGARKAFSEAVRVAPNSAAAHYNMGRVLFDLHRYDEARRELDRACQLAPDRRRRRSICWRSWNVS